MRIRSALITVVVATLALFVLVPGSGSNAKPPVSGRADYRLGDPLPQIHLTYLPLISNPGAYALYRSGQTFVVWPERKDLQGERYRIYRSNQPIHVDNLSQARLLAETGKGSANFYSGRYTDGNGNWSQRYVNRLVIQDKIAPLADGWGLIAWTLNSDDFNGGVSGSGYYAITVTPLNSSEDVGHLDVIGPVAEAVDNPSPVEITGSNGLSAGVGGHIYLQYMDLRNWNPTFHAPNPSNHYYGLDPNDPNLTASLQYAYDYAVYTPTAQDCGGSLPGSLPVIIHLHGWKDFNIGPMTGYNDPYCAYGVYPIDVSNTWYYGFARGNDYRKAPQPQSGDTVVNYTEQRVLRMLSDLMRSPPGPVVDAQRIYVSGQSMGGSGALAFAMRYENVFAAAYASQPMTNFRTAGVTSQDWVADASIKWGAPSLNLPISISAPRGWADHLQRYAGNSIWDWQDYPAAVSILREEEIAPIGVTHGLSDPVILWQPQGQPLYDAFNSSGRTWGGRITNDTHQWGYYQGLPPALAALGDTIYNCVPFWRLSVVHDETVPGLSNASGDLDIPTNKTGGFNQTIQWSSSWNPWDGAPIDAYNHWQISLCSVAVGSTACGSGVLQSVDVTPRRVVQFHLVPGATYAWQNLRISDNGVIDHGLVTADDKGLITIHGFNVSPRGNRLLIDIQ